MQALRQNTFSDLLTKSTTCFGKILRFAITEMYVLLILFNPVKGIIPIVKFKRDQKNKSFYLKIEELYDYFQHKNYSFL